MLAVGVVTLDILLEVDSHPPEDAEVRAQMRRLSRGGNAANTLSVLSQLGHQGAWVGVVADKPETDFLLADLDRSGIDHRHGVRRTGGVPTSYICLSRVTGSRTIVHYRDLPELTAAEFARVPLDGYDWVHFEGRNPTETAAMIQRVKDTRKDLTVSVELEKPREGIERLFEGPDVLLIAKAFAQSGGAHDAASYLRDLLKRTTAPRCFLGWGRGGGYAIEAGRGLWHSPAYQPPQVVDTLGAGDVFNAGVIDGLLQGLDPPSALQWACRLAGLKCGQTGLDGLPLDAGSAA